MPSCLALGQFQTTLHTIEGNSATVNVIGAHVNAELHFVVLSGNPYTGLWGNAKPQILC